MKMVTHTHTKRALHVEADPALAALAGEINRAFAHFNKMHWQGRLPEPQIAWFPQPPNGSRLGHYMAGAWVSGDERRDEIIFYADLCFSAGPDQILRTLAHEMAHLWQEHFGAEEKGPKGKPGKNNHHNQAWHAEMARIGLKSEGPKGHTETTPEFDRQVKEFAFRVDAVPFRAPKTRTKGKSKKWTCGCGFAVRVAKAEFNAQCLECGEHFEMEES